jgi:hypothetical protein
MSKRGKPSAVEDDDQVLAELDASLNGWVAAIEAHRTAPPDAGFGTRLAGLAAAAGEQARVYRTAAPDFEWVPGSGGHPPYELQPNTGRRGPGRLWQRFDAAVTRLGVATEGEDMIEVADAYEDLAAAAAELSKAIEREDAADSQRPRTRARRSA